MIVRWLCEREQCEVMSGWCPSSSCTPLNGGGVRCYWTALSVVCGLCYLPPVCIVRVLQSCCILFSAWRVVCGGGVCLYSFVWWGILRSPLPSSWWRVGGCRGWWGVCCGGGWHGVEGRVLLHCPSRLMLASPFYLCSGLVEWRGVACAGVSPCSGWVWHLVLSCLSACLLSQHCWFSVMSL